MSSFPPNLPGNVVPFPGRLSSGKRLDVCSGAAFDAHAFYADFPDYWAALLGQHFGSAVDVAGHFRVTERAAAKWLDGIGGPRGDKLAMALLTLPGAMEGLRTFAATAPALRRVA